MKESLWPTVATYLASGIYRELRKAVDYLKTSSPSQDGGWFDNVDYGLHELPSQGQDHTCQ
jgi:hypothetical protein